MAASLVRSFALGVCAKTTIGLRAVSVNQTWARTAFFRRGKDKEDETEAAAVIPEEESVPSPLSLAKTLRKRVGLQTVRGYTPPSDVEERLQTISSQVCGDVADWKNYRFENNRIKFKFLTRAMTEFDHFIPNSDLNNIQTVSDAVAFFSTAVRDTSSYEDISKLDLPPNLHIQLEPLRFDPETDTMYGGKTAFPDRPTVISSLKYQRKYGKKEE